MSTFCNSFVYRCLPSRKATLGPRWCLLRPLSRRSGRWSILIADQKRRLIQDQARLEPLCAALDPRTDSNWACLRTPPFVSVAQNEKPASCFRPGRAGRVPQPSLVRSPLDSPIEVNPCLRFSMLTCFVCAFRQKRLCLTLIDWFDAQPSTCRFQLAFGGGRGPPG